MAPPIRNDSNLDDVRGDVQKLLSAIQENNKSAIEDRVRLTAKVDAIPEMFNQLRREQSQAIDSLRRDFERLFVPRAEYDPKHNVILDKIKEYDDIIRSSRAAQDEYSALKQTVKTHSQQILDLETHSGGTVNRVAMWISVAIAVLSLLLNFASHLQVR